MATGQKQGIFQGKDASGEHISLLNPEEPRPVQPQVSTAIQRRHDSTQSSNASSPLTRQSSYGTIPSPTTPMSAYESQHEYHHSQQNSPSEAHPHHPLPSRFELQLVKPTWYKDGHYPHPPPTARYGHSTGSPTLQHPYPHSSHPPPPNRLGNFDPPSTHRRRSPTPVNSPPATQYPYQHSSHPPPNHPRDYASPPNSSHPPPHHPRDYASPPNSSRPPPHHPRDYASPPNSSRPPPHHLGNYAPRPPYSRRSPSPPNSSPTTQHAFQHGALPHRAPAPAYHSNRAPLPAGRYDQTSASLADASSPTKQHSYPQDSIPPPPPPSNPAPNVPANHSGYNHSVREGSGEPAKRYPCRLAKEYNCNKTFTTSGHASRHAKIHNAEKSVPCSWQGCTKSFTRSDNMKQHLETHKRLKKTSEDGVKKRPTVKHVKPSSNRSSRDSSEMGLYMQNKSLRGDGAPPRDGASEHDRASEHDSMHVEVGSPRD